MEDDYKKEYQMFDCPKCRCKVVYEILVSENANKIELYNNKERLMEKHLELHRKAEAYDQMKNALKSY